MFNFHITCFLIDEYGYQYCGIAKCNYEEGDIFFENIGQKIAFQKAIEKWEKVKNKIIENIIKREYDKRRKVINGLKYKLHKLIQKEKI